MEDLRCGRSISRTRRVAPSGRFTLRRRHQSGLTRTAYCREHGLNKSTFDRWLTALNALESQKIKQRAWRKRTRRPIGAKDKHNKAVQAFWAMHVEAMDWCGLTTREYAAAHRLSWWSLKTWRKRLATGEIEIDWRAHLHLSAGRS
jgi:hypothetical protein